MHDATGLSDATMQQFAHWTNLSETTFLLPPTDPNADYRVRIFFPTAELPFAGHPTLGSCHAWLAAGGKPHSRDEIVQQCGVGLVRVRRDGKRLAFAAPPLRRSGDVDAATLAAITRSLGIERKAIRASQWVDNGPGWVAVMLGSRDELLALKPDFARSTPKDIGVVAPLPPSQRSAVRDARVHRRLGAERGSRDGQPTGRARAMADRRAARRRSATSRSKARRSGATAASTSRSAATTFGSAATA